MVSEQYPLEYGYDTLELHADAVKAQTRYAIVDDVIATGGTTDAAWQGIAMVLLPVASF